MNKNEREKRNESIIESYISMMGEPYIALTGQKGSDEVISKIAKKHKLSKPSIYSILKSA